MGRIKIKKKIEILHRDRGSIFQNSGPRTKKENKKRKQTDKKKLEHMNCRNLNSSNSCTNYYPEFCFYAVKV